VGSSELMATLVEAARTPCFGKLKNIATFKIKQQHKKIIKKKKKKRMNFMSAISLNVEVANDNVPVQEP
jgi:hypothetical protein